MVNPVTADVVIIGGGVIGCSVAYHLAQIGVQDVLLLERESLASGATGIALGGIRQQFAGEADCLLAQRSMRFWERINDILEPEHPFRFERTGYMFLADSNEVLQEFRRNVTMQNRLGIPSQLVSREDIAELIPQLRTDSLAGGSYCAEDGFLEDCHGVTVQLMRRAAENGARALYQTVTSIERSGNRWRTHTNQGICESVHLVLAAGPDSVAIAEGVGVELPITREQRRFAFSTPHEEHVLTPLIISPEKGFVAKQLTEGVLFFGWMRETADDDDGVFVERALEAGVPLLPMLNDLPIRRVIHGIYDSTPDHRPILGGVPGVDHLWVAAGFSGHGFMIAPAVGELIAGAVIGQKGEQALPPFSLARFAQTTQAEGLVI
jgi:sarcosine oxidase subunit beta